MICGQRGLLQFHLLLDALDYRSLRFHGRGKTLSHRRGRDGAKFAGHVQCGKDTNHCGASTDCIVPELAALIVIGKQVMELWPERLCDEEDAIRVGGLEVLANTPDEVGRVDQVAHIQHNQTAQPEADEHGNVQGLSEVLKGGVKG